MEFKKWIESIEQKPFGEDNAEGKPELVVLIGPPAIGKSTFIKKNFHPGSTVVVSRDDIVNQVADENGMTYDDMFIKNPKTDAANKEVNRRLADHFAKAVRSGKNVVVDMTNMNANSRRNAMSKIAGMERNFFKRAVVFTMKDTDLPALLARMEARATQIKNAGGSKTIGKDVIMRMIQSFQQVNPDEGFDRVDTVNSFENS